MSGKRNVLNYQLKRQIIDEMTSGTKNVEVCKKFGIPSSTVSTLWKYRHKILAQAEDMSPFSKRARKSTKDDLDAALMAWIKNEGHNVNLTGTVLRAQADKIAAELGHVNFSCSKGWLHRFRARHNICYEKSKRLEHEKQWLKSKWNDGLRKSYVDEDVYAAHEVGLFYDATPDVTTSKLIGEKCLNGELPESRLTVLLCCNMDGTDKRPLAVVGSSQIDLIGGFLEGMLMTYSHNPYAWMTEEVFEKELFLWDEELRQAKRSILVIVSSCSAHVRMTALENIQLCLLPSNSHGLQPIEKGIERSFRSHYRRQLILAMNDIMKTETSRKITLLEALNLLSKSWALTDRHTIITAFIKAGLAESISTPELVDVKLSKWLEDRSITMEMEHLDYYEVFDEGLTTCTPDVGLITCIPDVTANFDIKQEPQTPGDQHESEPSYSTTTTDEAREALKILTCFFEERSKKAETLLALDVLKRNIDDVIRENRDSNSTSNFVNILLRRLFFVGHTQQRPEALKDAQLRDFTKFEMKSRPQLGVQNEESTNGDDENSHSNKQAKPNPCVSCLGLLQWPYSDFMIDEILKGADVSLYDAKTFNVSMNLPSCYLLRSEALLVELRKHFPAFYEENFEGQPLFGLKDAFKACFGHRLGKTFNLTLDLTSGFVIDIEFQYDDDLKECKPLCSLRPGIFTRQYVKKNGYTKNRIESILETMENDEFLKAFQVPPVVPTEVIRIVKVTLVRESANVAGRYNKYCRNLPQTPWVLNGERKMESSVEEIISGPIVALLGGTTSKFASSGREDVDVRALGSGRPFNVEVIMPKVTSIQFEQFRALEKEITENSQGKLRVRDLQIVARETLVTLKQGEEEKTKEYQALCICPDGVPDTLEEAAGRAPLVLDQSTPIRVLHRRPVAVRQKEILEMTACRLEGDKHKFILNLKTQAGTYIKEFIHGDLGRTKPSFGDLLGGVKVDILALDVTDIALDWPPRISYVETKHDEVNLSSSTEKLN